ncbi:MAG: DUF91 domain-containing protein [Pirellulales bacterium]|nr:DUF91 domain-containing protein [Pirellulales bacterium]
MNYQKVDVSEQQLEDLTRKYTGMIEEGLVYVDHQRQTAGGRLDVLMVDREKSLVVAELKIIEDDGMLLQGLDYFDYVSTHVETYARFYKEHSINPTKEVRLLLIAPSFSQALINRCKWLNLEIRLFAFNCLKFDGQDETVPIFSEQTIPTSPPPPDDTTIEKHLAYITDEGVRNKVMALLKEIENWKPGAITIEPIKNAISMKVNNRVFTYLDPRQKHFLIETFNAEDEWTVYPVKNDEQLTNVKALAKAAMERKMRI